MRPIFVFAGKRCEVSIICTCTQSLTAFQHTMENHLDSQLLYYTTETNESSWEGGIYKIVSRISNVTPQPLGTVSRPK